MLSPRAKGQVHDLSSEELVCGGNHSDRLRVLMLLRGGHGIVVQELSVVDVGDVRNVPESKE